MRTKKMDIRKIKLKVKIKPQKINYYFYFLTAIATVIVLIIVSLFLYKNFYQTITQSEEILILQKKVATETVDMDKFNKLMEKIDKKTEERNLGGLNNPFD
jgi:uncharacterized membrane protein YqiK